MTGRLDRTTGTVTRVLPRVGRARRGFSLAELLLAIFILGIGVISIAALFPAGIAQQRQSADDAIGTVVAESALGILRTKLRPESFGYDNTTLTSEPNVIVGDFGWRRPAYVTNTAGATIPGGGATMPGGSILIFNPGGLSLGAVTDSEVPWNDVLYGNAPPAVVITQRERYWPTATQYSTEQAPPRPQYVWDCMFRRFQGRMQVAIFVYRVTRPGGESGPYVVAANPSEANVPPLPVAVDLATPWVVGDELVPGTDEGTTFDPLNDAQAWQLPGQWLLDQNNNVHRVISGRRNQAEGPVRLAAPITGLIPPAVGFLGPFGDWNAVTRVWFMPAKDSRGNSLSPVYLTVREL